MTTWMEGSSVRIRLVASIPPTSGIRRSMIATSGRRARAAHSATRPLGSVGTRVTITGHNLSGATEVAFNGTPATIVSDTATEIVTVVPAGATTGRISVTTAAGTATSAGTFIVDYGHRCGRSRIGIAVRPTS